MASHFFFCASVLCYCLGLFYAFSNPSADLGKKIVIIFVLFPSIFIYIFLSNFLYLWSRRAYFFFAKPLPVFLNSQAKNWAQFILWPFILSAVLSSVFCLVINVWIVDWIIPPSVKAVAQIQSTPQQSLAQASPNWQPSSLIATQAPPAGMQNGLVRGVYAEERIYNVPWALGSVAGSLPRNESIFVEDYGGLWLKVVSPRTGLNGYIARNKVSIQSPKIFPPFLSSGEKKAYPDSKISDGYIEIKQSPEESSRSLESFRQDEVVYVSEENDKWYRCLRIKTGKNGYVRKDLLQVAE